MRVADERAEQARERRGRIGGNHHATVAQRVADGDRFLRTSRRDRGRINLRPTLVQAHHALDEIGGCGAG